MLPRTGDRRLMIAAAVLAAASFFSVPVFAGDGKPQPHVVRDLYYGEVLWHFYQQDDFTALVHLLASLDADRVPNHRKDSELLLGGLYLSYGQHRRATEIFDRLLHEVSDPAVRDQAWFYLGKVRYQRGRYAEAIEALDRVGDTFGGTFQDEKRLLLAQSYLAQGEFAAAADVLDESDGDDAWKAYAAYNLGVALVRLGRVADGVARLDAVGRLDAESDELTALRDKANVALGFTYLQQNRPAEAKAILQRVRLNGPMSNKALLGVGWADIAQDEFRGALSPWLELTDRDVLDSAVQESLLAIPYALQQLNADGSAAEYYRNALDVFNAETRSLDDAIGRAQSGALIPALLRVDDPNIGRWYWELEEVPDSNDARYLYHLIADHDFQEGLRNFRDLLALSDHLGDWREKLVAFRDMLDTRDQAWNEKLPATQARLSEVDVNELTERRNALAARLDEIETSRDVMGLASDAQSQAWDTLTKLERNPAFSAADGADARTKHRVLKGVVLWEADRDYKLRLWEQRRELAALDRALADTSRLWEATQLAQIDDPAVRAAYRERIDRVQARIVELNGGIVAALDRQQDELQTLAARELEMRKDRLSTYQVQARFSLATIYDRATAALPAADPESTGETAGADR